MKTIFVLIACLALVGCHLGCQANGQPDCTKIRAAYVQTQTAVAAAQQTLKAQQDIIDALPPNDPLRQTLAGPLAKAQAYAEEAQIGMELAGAMVAAMCPAITPVPLSAKATQRWKVMQ